jgi:shikimate dehydrogenase
MKKYGIIGYPLTHSFSVGYFTDKFKKESLSDHEYVAFPIESISDFPEIVKSNPDLCGLNVTHPHKIGIIYYMDSLDEAAKEIDAVNCIKIANSHPVEDFFSGELSSTQIRLEGYNTDAYGFEHSLKPLLHKRHQKALILGSGGASRAVAYVLKKLHIEYQIVCRRARSKQLGYTDVTADLLTEHLLIINTTPLGTSPNINECPDIPYEYLTDKHLVYDLVYNPAETEFLKRAKQKGAAIKNGLEMLHIQAEKAWEIWNS